MAVQLANKHVLIVGGSGQGKSSHEIKELVEQAQQNKTAIIVVDPHGTMTQELVAHLYDPTNEIDSQRILYDRLVDVDRVLKWDFLTPSTAANRDNRQGANQTRCERFVEILLRRRGKGSAADTPMTEEWLYAALNLYIFQRQHRPLSDIRYAFSFEHPRFGAMLDGCTDDDTVYKFRQLIDDGKNSFVSAQRLIEKVFQSPAFRLRTDHGGGFNFTQHLNRKGIILIEGGAGGDLSPDAMEVMMGSVVLKTFDFLRARKREFPSVILCLDEATNANLVGEAGQEVKALAELRKWGLEMHIMVQRFDFPGQITKDVITNCDTKKYYKCAETSTANLAGIDLGGSFETEGTKTHHLRDGSSWESPASIDNPYANEIRNLSRGECYIRRGNVNERVTITPLPDPFSGLPKKALTAVVDGFVQEIKKRDEYYTPENATKQLKHADAEIETTQPTSPLDDGESQIGLFG